MRRAAILLALAALPAAPRAEPLAASICYNYGCQAQQQVSFDDALFASLAEVLATATDAKSERHAIAAVVAHMYVAAGRQSPIWRDRGGDSNDDGIEGAMDCIDHATNTTTFLKLLEVRGLLRFHNVGEPVKRGFFAEHWAAQVRERGVGGLHGGINSGAHTVDSWFYEFGMPAVIMSLKDWQGGLRPPGIGMGFR